MIIWGKNDEVVFNFLYQFYSLEFKIFFLKMLHHSGGKLLFENIKNSKLHILEECNHVLQLDQPKQTVKHILEFINEQFYLKINC